MNDVAVLGQTASLVAESVQALRRRVHEVARADDALVAAGPQGKPAGEQDATDDVELLMLFCPGAPREGYFRELTAAFQRDVPPTEEEIDDIARRFDQVNVRD